MPLAMPMSASSTAPATMAVLDGPMKPAATPESTRPTTIRASEPPPALPAKATMEAIIRAAPRIIGRRSPQRLASRPPSGALMLNAPGRGAMMRAMPATVQPYTSSSSSGTTTKPPM